MSNDLISREALKEAMRKAKRGHYAAFSDVTLQGIYRVIDKAPSVEERPQGEWEEDGGIIACSHCHTIWLYRRTDFCPNCGADMRGEDHETD